MVKYLSIDIDIGIRMGTDCLAFVISANKWIITTTVGLAKFVAKKTINDSLLEVAKFEAQKSSNMQNDNELEVFEITLIPKPLMALIWLSIYLYHEWQN